MVPLSINKLDHSYHNHSTKSLVKNNQRCNHNLSFENPLKRESPSFDLEFPLQRDCLIVPCLLEMAKVFEIFQSYYCISLPILQLSPFRKNVWLFI